MKEEKITLPKAKEQSSGSASSLHTDSSLDEEGEEEMEEHVIVEENEETDSVS